MPWAEAGATWWLEALWDADTRAKYANAYSKARQTLRKQKGRCLL